MYSHYVYSLKLHYYDFCIRTDETKTTNDIMEWNMLATSLNQVGLPAYYFFCLSKHCEND